MDGVQRRDIVEKRAMGEKAAKWLAEQGDSLSWCYVVRLPSRLCSSSGGDGRRRRGFKGVPRGAFIRNRAGSNARAARQYARHAKVAAGRA